jgi:hypothetical protein
MVLVFWSRPEIAGGNDITKIRVNGANDRFGTFLPITTISPAYSGSPAVWTLQYFDPAGTDASWYVIEYLTTQTDSTGSQDIVVAKTEPMQGEPTTASAVTLMWKLRRKIGDLGAIPCFADYELLEQLNEALILHNRFMNWETLPEVEYTLVLWLAVSNIALMLAQDSSKFYALSIDGLIVDKSNRVQHYTALSDKYMERYEEKKEEWHLASEKSGTVQEGAMTRESMTTGRRVSNIFALPPEPIRLMPANVITAGSVDLRWEISHDPGFYYYVIFRSTAPNQQKRLIEDTYHKRVALYDDPGDYANALWGGVTIPVRMIFRNSVNFWMDQNRVLSDPYFQGPYPELFADSDYYYVIGVVNKNILLTLSNEIHIHTPVLGAPDMFSVIRSVEGMVMGGGIPTAMVYIEYQAPGTDTWVQVANADLRTGTIAAFRFSFGVGSLAVGGKVRAYQIFNNEQSPYTAEIVVI